MLKDPTDIRVWYSGLSMALLFRTDQEESSRYCLIVSVSNQSKPETEVYVFYSKSQVENWLHEIRAGLLQDSREGLMQLIQCDNDLPAESQEAVLEFSGREAVFLEALANRISTLEGFVDEDEETDDEPFSPPSSFN